MIGQIFFALWVLPRGVLIYKSGFIPRVFAVLFGIEAVFGVAAAIVHFLVPNAPMETIMMMPMMVAEFSFVLYLLIRGIDESGLTLEHTAAHEQPMHFTRFLIWVNSKIMSS